MATKVAKTIANTARPYSFVMVLLTLVGMSRRDNLRPYGTSVASLLLKRF
jgi:hypothetical protein